MFHLELDLARLYKIGPYNGTTPVAQVRLDEENTLVVVESAAMMGDLHLTAAPKRARSLQAEAPNPAVVASLERSLKEHADVWAELSKY